MLFTRIALAIGVAILPVFAHPGEDENPSDADIFRRHVLSKRCASQVGILNQKRWTAGEAKRRSLSDQGTTTVEITTVAPHIDFLQNDTCILTPEAVSGPYIWPESQTLRQDMSEDQPGVPLYLDIGVVDVNTCEPLEGVLVDLWHCNATGSYSSFTALSPNVLFPNLLRELNITNFTAGVTDIHTDDSTFLRGFWPTDANGVMEMKTVFPGFYAGRALHIHVEVHTNWIVRENGTIVSDNTVSTGQLYFAEDLSAQIMALDPYVTHTQINRTTNNKDGFYPTSATHGYNPVFNVVPLDGEDVTKGVLAYITIGVDPTTTG